jgi:hypothetical protein
MLSVLDVDETVSRKTLDGFAALRARELKTSRTPRHPTDEERRAARPIPARAEGKDLFNLE